MQSSNQDKMSTIHMSAASDEVKKALEKNPDISKERTNLLEGAVDMIMKYVLHVAYRIAIFYGELIFAVFTVIL